MTTPIPHFRHEKRLIASGLATHVCGVDEAGRGPWAGPVVASAVMIPDQHRRKGWVRQLRDSKLLTAEQRADLFAHIQDHCVFGIGLSSPEEIDQVNILQATWLAMQRAVAELSQAPCVALVDGNLKPAGLTCQIVTLIKGDQQSCSIAAASILAKVTRDRIMHRYCTDYPVYGFSSHVGYGTPAHQKALAEHGPCPLHRKSFKPIAALLAA